MSRTSSPAPAMGIDHGDARRTYSPSSVVQILGMTRRTIGDLVRAGFVTPARDAHDGMRFTLNDLMLLRTAQGLREAGIPPRRIASALEQLRAELPEHGPLTGLRITAAGDAVAVHAQGESWEVESGQLLLEFEVTAAGGRVSLLPTRHLPHGPETLTAEQWVERAAILETTDAAAAEAAYRSALGIDPSLVGAYLNLGVMLCEAKRCDDALELYDLALRHCGHEPLVHFNRAIALEDRGEDSAAIAAYERCLELDQLQADAHFNVARLLEHSGDAPGALRHLSAYRRLTRVEPSLDG